MSELEKLTSGSVREGLEHDKVNKGVDVSELDAFIYD